MVYKQREFPWTSKSIVKSKDYCEFLFWLNKIEGKERKEKREDAVEGTNMHMVFAEFYRALKPEHVFTDEFTDSRTSIHFHPFRRFMYEACMQFVKPIHREWGKYRNIINNFSTLETQRWLNLNSKLTDKGEIFSYFKPVGVEKTLLYEPIHMFGTIDRININVMSDGSKKIGIFDYKTGNIPRAITSHIYTGDIFSWKLRTDMMKEVHFYGLLYLLSVGWQLSEKVIDFLENPDWWYVKKGRMDYSQTLKQKSKYLTSLGNDYKLWKDGKYLNKGDIIVGIDYLNGDKPYHVTKEYNYSSHKSVLLSINDYRSVVHNKYYAKHPVVVFDEEKCGYKNCHRFEKCKEEVKLYNSIKT